MKKIAKPFFLLFLIIFSLVLFIVIFFPKTKILNNVKNFNSTSPKNKDFILIGSSSTQQLYEEMGLEFSKKFSNINFIKTGGGSSEAVLAVKKNIANVGDLSRELTTKEKKYGFYAKTIAQDMIAICVNKNNPIKNISTEDLKKIFTKKIKNWAEIGGKNSLISLIGRDDASGTRLAFEKILNSKLPPSYDVILETNGKVKFKIQNDEDSIGYLSFSSCDDLIKPLYIDGVAPTIKNVLNSTYFFKHPLIQITKSEPKDKITKAWFNFVHSKEGAKIIERNKFIAIT